jgi:hypothetical protein
MKTSEKIKLVIPDKLTEGCIICFTGCYFVTLYFSNNKIVMFNIYLN